MFKLHLRRFSSISVHLIALYHVSVVKQNETIFLIEVEMKMETVTRHFLFDNTRCRCLDDFARCLLAQSRSFL